MINAVIIDDEKKVRNVLHTLLQRYCSGIINVTGQAGSVEEGVKLIIEHDPQLVFLDIEMPDGDGFELLQRFDQISFETIFVTSYSNYSIKAIRFSAFDYLLKPVIVDDLKAAVERLEAKFHEGNFRSEKYQLLKNNLADAGPRELVINTRSRFETINTGQLLYLQADSNYTYIFALQNQRFHVAKTLKEYEALLCGDNSPFLRIHKKYIVNIQHLKYIERGDQSKVMLSNGTEIELSRRKKGELMHRLSNLRVPAG